MHPWLTRLAGPLLLVVCGVAMLRAEPYVDHLDPPALTRGKTTKLTLAGNDLDRAQAVWFTLPEKFFQVNVVSSNLTRTEVEITTTAECPLGLYGLRLATEDGLSNLHLLAIDDLEAGPANNQLTKLPAAIAGDLLAAEVDRIRFSAAAGERISFDIVCSRFGKDADPLLTIVDERGKRVAQRDNSPGLFYDCQFAHTFAGAGTYTLEVRDSRYLGSPDWRYWLRIGNFPAARVSLPSTIVPGQLTKLALPEIAGSLIEIQTPADQPLGAFYQLIKSKDAATATWLPLIASPIPAAVETEPNDSKDSPTHVDSLPASLQGVINHPGDVDCFSLLLKKGDKFTVRAETKPLQSAADLELVLLDRTGREIQRMDDVQLPGGALDEAAFNFNVGDSGQYQLQVRDMSGSGSPAHTYQIEITPQQPKLELKSEISALSVPLRSYQRLPFTVVRTDCPGPIELSLVNAPAGVQLEPTTIPEGSNAIDCKLIAAENVALGLSSLQVIATTKAGDQELVAPLVVQPLVDRQLINVDLIKHALRENQRWLPANVTRSIALQIVPTVPFSVELAEPTLTLPRYQQATATIVTTRDSGFTEPITFTALGGQCGEEKQGRKQVFARIPVATTDQLSIPALFISRSLANDVTERVDITAVAKHGNRTITLTRSLQLAVKPGFEVTFDPPPPTTLPPGSKFNLRLVVQRLPSFTGPVSIEPQRIAGLELPETINIAAEANSAEFEVTIPDDFRPGRHRFRFSATGQVGNFQEEPKPKEFDLEVKAPPMEKKK